MKRCIYAELLKADIRPFAEYESNRNNKDWVRRVEVVIDNQPTADVRENVKGKWKIEYTGDGWNDYIDVTCTNCGKTIKHGKPFNYCPNCGADMRRRGGNDYERSVEQMEHDALYEPTYNSEDGSM